MNLSPAQDAIVHAPRGPLLVTATAGSGKTRVLTERIRFLLQENPKEEILALTFTNKAADEMQKRLNDIDQLEQRTFIGTLHSFAQDILQRHGHHIGVAAKLHIFEREEDKLRLLDEIVDTSASMVCTPSAEYLGQPLDRDRRRQLYDWLNVISRIKRNLWTEEDIIENSAEGELASYIYRSYQESLIQHGAIDFDDLLVLAYRLISEKPRIAKLIAQVYPHVCVDEAQDLNKAQYEFLKTLCKDRILSIMMVGDPNQSIYGFNDASADYMLVNFIQDFNPKEHHLIDNYRSSSWVLALANRIKPASMVNMQAATNGGGAFYTASSSEDEANWICDHIQEWLQTGKHQDIEGVIQLNNIVVLARNRYVFIPLHEELEKRQIPHYLKTTPVPADPVSEIGKVFDWAMRVRINPQDRLHERQLRLKIGATDSSKTWEHCKTEWEKIIETIQNGLTTVIDSNQPSMKSCVSPLRDILTQGKVEFSDMEKANALHDLADFEEHWQRYISQLPTGAPSSLVGFRAALAMGKTQLDQQETGVALSTVHTMKGLEYDIVFLMGLGQGTFPDYRAIDKPKAMVEEDNNVFVAITRAKRFLYISYPKYKTMPWGGTKYQDASVYWDMLLENKNELKGGKAHD
jgi:DNA helicase-2/ATP-dependent DNA helicase PcrA